MKRTKVCLVMGARPNFMKIAPLIKKYESDPNLQKQFDICLVHTGQHYDEAMSTSFLKALEITKIHHHLQVGSGSQAEQTAKIMIGFEKVCLEEKPDWVLVVGDVNSTLACAITAKKTHASVCHVEAGLRSNNRRMPEEINRLATDAISDLFLTTSTGAGEHLLKENIPQDKIEFVGNLMIDSLFMQLDKPQPPSISKIMEAHQLQSAPFALLTLHRPENVDKKETLQPILENLKRASNEVKILFPCHPRTKKNIEAFGLKYLFNDNFVLHEPLDYFTMVHFYKYAKLVLTDSGGVQEETTALQVPCLTLRGETERPVTVEVGSNTIIGMNFDLMFAEISNILAGTYKKGSIPNLWDGKAAERVWEKLSAITN